MTITLWHCKDSRSLRPLWALEEMGLDYRLETLQFPPRVFHKDYLEINPLGTVPFFRDGDTEMTESSAIGHYLVEKYQRYDFGLPPEHPEYGAYLNWLYHSDATLTFPQTLVLRYGQFEPDERKQPQVAEDYRQWYLARLRKLDAHLEQHDFLCDDRFTIADIAVGYALLLGELGTDTSKDYTPQTREYLARLKCRPALQRALANS
ncbi:glutathione S-transferase family protein [Motiliproteus coralliicola]|uniref:Glutathione S-transferase family protein n=1 Tax=Motiliproteus coralliicola TaxID=2283196 RepID=A0A369WRT1_9GAMM|nr:glutathione S-transferase family protein [Motiliproteus coralliicola]RDE24367.1 glutathione S-transferase family protein [Motiliproteus coralliicola]